LLEQLQKYKEKGKQAKNKFGKCLQKTILENEFKGIRE
jgi:hypothetical protein